MSNSNTNQKEVDIREVESPSAFYKNIPKVKNAPYVAGLEPERYGQLTPLGHNFDNLDEEELLRQQLDPNSTYYSSSTKTLGILMILLAFSFFGVWNYIYNQEARYIPTNQQGAQSSFQNAGVQESASKNKNNKNKKNSGNNIKKPTTTTTTSASKKAPVIKTAPDAVGLWSNVEFSLDKIRAIETLKGFAVYAKDDLTEWLSHPLVVDALFQCFAVFCLTVVSIAIARAIPAFTIFACVGIVILGWIATLGDVFIVGRTLRCFDVLDADETVMNTVSDKSSSAASASSSLVISAAGCSFPLIMHAFCVNTKWLCLTLATTILIISVRLRGGFCFGAFKNLINLSVLSGLPVCAQALRLYLWYTGLGVVKDAVGPEDGWILTHREELIAMSFHVSVFVQCGLWVLFGIALFGQGTLIVLEQELPKNTSKSDEHRSKIKGIDDEDGENKAGQEEENENKSGSTSSSAQRSWKSGSEVRSKLGETAAGSNNKKED